MSGNRAQNSNTRPKLSELSCRRSTQHNKGIETMSSPVLSHSALDGVPHKEYARHDGLQNLNAHHRTDSRRTLDQPPNTTMKTDSVWRTSELAAPLQLTTAPGWNTELESSLVDLMRPSLTPEPIKVAAVSATLDPVVEPLHLSCSWTCFPASV